MERYIFMLSRNNRNYFYDTRGRRLMVFIPDYAKGTAWDKTSVIEALSIPLTGFISTLLYILYMRFKPPVLHVNAFPAYVLAACLTGLLLAFLTARAVTRGYKRQCCNLTDPETDEAAAAYRAFRKNTLTLTVTAIVLLVLVVIYPFFLKIGGTVIVWLAYLTFWYVLWLIVCVVRLDRRWKIVKTIKKKGEEI